MSAKVGIDRASRSQARRDALIVTAVALAARLLVVFWAAGRFAPAADGVYYHRIATRIAEGFGYTWLWPDGAVTYAAHYPIGYPGAIGALYALFGADPVVAMIANAFVGSLAALAAHRLVASAASRRIALAAGLLVALHPGLVAYTPALMTEGVTAALLVTAAWAAASARGANSLVLPKIVLVGLVLGAATLVRPQSILLAPLLGFAMRWGRAPLRRASGPVVAAALTTVVALGCCAPWTVRNCVRMNRCALVSVNAGWNLLIGADPEARGAWAPAKVPEACLEVWDEAAKDACFEREARLQIAADPLGFVALAPAKLAATFDYAGAAGYYLHASNPEAFDASDKVALGAVETLYERVLLIAALCSAMAWKRSARGRRRPDLRAPRTLVALLGAAATLTLHAWIGYAALAVSLALRGESLKNEPFAKVATLAALAATIATHAVFFGAGRYGLVVFPLVAAVAALCVSKPVADAKHEGAAS